MLMSISWKYHASELHKKLSKTAGLLLKVRHCIPQSTLAYFCHSVFSSFLNSGIVVWGLNMDSNFSIL